MRQEWLGLREFARRCGRTHHAAQLAIHRGRIPAEAVRRDGGRIVRVELHLARLTWLAHPQPHAGGREPLRARGAAPAPNFQGVRTDPFLHLVDARDGLTEPGVQSAATRARKRSEAAKRRNEIADCYVRSKLREALGPSVAIPENLIEAKRAHLKVARLLKVRE